MKERTKNIKNDHCIKTSKKDENLNALDKE